MLQHEHIIACPKKDLTTLFVAPSTDPPVKNGVIVLVFDQLNDPQFLHRLDRVVQKGRKIYPRLLTTKGVEKTVLVIKQRRCFFRIYQTFDPFYTRGFQNCTGHFGLILKRRDVECAGPFCFGIN